MLYTLQFNNGLAPQSPLYTPGVPIPMDFSFPAQEGSSHLQLTSEADLPKAALADIIGQTQTFVTENQVRRVYKLL